MRKHTTHPVLGFERHDHTSCISDGVAAADAYCVAEGLQLTPARRRVLEILLSGHRARGAYAILDTLRSEGLGSQPPVVYRALDFLVAHGFVHRIERRNAFIACCRPGDRHDPVFLICRGCDAVAEASARPAITALGGIARDAGFEIDRVVVEAEGLCPNCRSEDAA